MAPVQTEEDTEVKAISLNVLEREGELEQMRQLQDFNAGGKLVLLWDKEYEAAHVVAMITKIVEEMGRNEATTVVEEAKLSGKAVITFCPEDQGNFYRTLLRKCDPPIFAKVEVDKTQEEKESADK